MTQTGEFNEAQKRRLLSSGTYIDKLLTDIEQILYASQSGGFPKYKNPLTPVQIRVVQDYIKRVRQQILHVLSTLDVPLPEARFDSTHSIRVTLQFIEVALEEAAPERLVGYGAVPQSLVPQLAGGIQEIKGIIRQIDAYVTHTSGADLTNRIVQLQQSDGDIDLLKQLNAMIERHSLIEFRASLSQLIERMEYPAYEIAFFGRVSAGKSSLLNRIMGLNLLPTGVTPVTAVPTRVKNSAVAALHVWTADGRYEKYPAERLADFVTEAKNPGNEKHVTRLILTAPLSMLPDEVVLVDTPGLGSLALRGAAETLTYLPRCDLGIVLIDSSSSIQPDDVATIDTLLAASIPSLAVLSKIDLVPEEEREHLIDYTRKQLAYQLGTEIDVAALSSHPEWNTLLESWVSNQIDPRVSNAKQLSMESNQRKVRSLCQRVLHALETLAGQAGPSLLPETSQQLKRVEEHLRVSIGKLDSIREKCFQITDGLRNADGAMLDLLAGAAISLWQQHPNDSELDQSWVEKEVRQAAQHESESVARMIQELAAELTAALYAAAQILSTEEQEERFALQRLVKEMPTPDFIAPVVHLKTSGWLAASRSLARRAVLHQLNNSIGGTLTEFLASYGREMEMWVRSSIDRLAAEFESLADIYRAQLQRLAKSNVSGGDMNQSISEDISSLRQYLQIRTAEFDPQPMR